MNIVIVIIAAAVAAAAAYAAGRVRSGQIISGHVDEVREARAAARKWEQRARRDRASLGERDAKVAELEVAIGYLSEARRLAEVELGHEVQPTGAWTLPATAKGVRVA